MATRIRRRAEAAVHAAGPPRRVSTILEELRAERVRTVPVLRRIRRQYSRALATAPARQVLELADRILTIPDPGLRFVAYELIHFHQGARTSLRKGDVERLGRGIQSWGEVDAFAYYVSGPAWRDGRLSDATVLAWASSADRWWRRAALVSSIALARTGARADLARTMMICESRVADRDEMVVKALSWALREIARQDPRMAARFVEKHRTVLAPRVVREVTNKIATGRKDRRPER